MAAADNRLDFLQKKRMQKSDLKRRHGMTTKILSLALVGLLSMTAAAVAAPTIKQTVASINADASKPGGPERVVKSISKSTGVPAATLESQKASTGLTYGDIFAAHSIAKASGKNFAEIAALKKKGQTWDQIADANGVDIGGKKTTAAKNDPAAKPSPTPPQKSLFQEQKDRYK
jgi:hypothetical protein